jgi:hypothetical protein
MLFEDLEFKSIEEIKEYLEGRRSGVFTKITYAVKINENCFKIVEMVVRFKINYRHLEKVIAKQKESETKERKMNDIILLENTLFFNTKTETTRLRCYTTTIKGKSTYYLNGKEISKKELIDMGIVKDKPQSECLCFTINASNIISIG